MNPVTRTIDALLSDPVAFPFFAVISMLFIVAVLAILLRATGHKSYMGNFVATAPSVFTTLGVLGTFFGIFIGLLDFDVTNIDASVPQLLNGLKIAFATSIVGMAAAIILKLLLTVLPAKDNAVDVTPDAIYGALIEIRDDARKNAEADARALHDLRRAISSDADASLLTQMQKLRTELQDGQKDLIAEFRLFANAMAENNTKAMIEALKEVIRDFNAKINEQFGDNFKQLNAAVGALLEWQENYRIHVERLEARLEIATTAIERSEMAIASITQNTALIPKAMEELGPILSGLETQTQELADHLEAFAHLREKATNAFPFIEENLTRITSGLTEMADQLVSDTRQSLEMQRSSFERLSNGYAEMQVRAATTQDNFRAELDKTMQSLQISVNKALADYYNLTELSSREMHKQISEAWAKTEEAINKQIATLDEQMQNELQRVINLMGGKLASLSEKFVADYTPLTERLREIVSMARV